MPSRMGIITQGCSHGSQYRHCLSLHHGFRKDVSDVRMRNVQLADFFSYYDNDADLALLDGKTIVFLG